MHTAFEVHKLNDRGMKKAQRLAAAFDTHLSIVQEIVGAEDGPPIRSIQSASAEFTMTRCVEHLELASFYAKKTLARKPENQDFGQNEAGKYPVDMGEQGIEAEAPPSIEGFFRLLRGMKFSKRDGERLMSAIAEQSR